MVGRVAGFDQIVVDIFIGTNVGPRQLFRNHARLDGLAVHDFAYPAHTTDHGIDVVIAAQEIWCVIGRVRRVG
ncbi:hypothetical protein D3C76_1651440 [compost metagenome]